MLIIGLMLCLLLLLGSIVAFVGGIIWLLVYVVKRKKVLKPMLLMLCSLIAFIVACAGMGVAFSGQNSTQEIETDDNVILQVQEEQGTEIQEAAKSSEIEENSKEQTEETAHKIQTVDEWFSETKEKSNNIARDLDSSDWTVNSQLNAIEETYYDVKALQSGMEAFEEESFITFALGIAYFDTHYEEGSVGKEIGRTGWEALESLFKEDGKFEEYMDLFKTSYEASGRKLFQNKFPAGQYRVGTDIDPGEYVFFSEASSAYFAITKDANGRDIIENDNFSKDSILTIYEGEYLKLSRCYAVPIDEVDILPIDSADMFKVGVHLPAGDYKLIADADSAYYCIYGDDRQSEIVSNDNFNNQSYISVTDGQYLKLSRCHIEAENIE